jgi:hypothetical protein
MDLVPNRQLLQQYKKIVDINCLIRVLDQLVEDKYELYYDQMFSQVDYQRYLVFYASVIRRLPPFESVKLRVSMCPVIFVNKMRMPGRLNNEIVRATD